MQIMCKYWMLNAIASTSQIKSMIWKQWQSVQMTNKSDSQSMCVDEFWHETEDVYILASCTSLLSSLSCSKSTCYNFETSLSLLGGGLPAGFARTCILPNMRRQLLFGCIHVGWPQLGMGAPLQSSHLDE